MSKIRFDNGFSLPVHRAGVHAAYKVTRLDFFEF